MRTYLFILCRYTLVRRAYAVTIRRTATLLFLLGVCSFFLRIARPDPLQVFVLFRVLQTATDDRVEYTQLAGNQKPHTQAEALQIFGREQLGHKPRVLVQPVPYSVSD